MNSLSDIVAALEKANADFETAKQAELEAISVRKSASLRQREAQQAFTEAVNALKKKRASPKKDKPKAEPKPKAVKTKAAA